MSSIKKQKTSKAAAASSKSRPTSKPVPASAPKREKKWTWKRPKDKPRRPLSAYNLFFRLERELLIESKGKRGTAAETRDALTMAVAKILAETKAEREAEEKAGGPIEHKRPHRRGCGNLGFKNLAQTIADRWKNLDQSDRMVYEAAAALEMKQYRHDLERWQLKQKLKQGQVGLTKAIVAKPNNSHPGERVEKRKTEDNGTGVFPSEQKPIPGQDFSAPHATIPHNTFTSFSPAFNPNIQLDFTPLSHTTLPFGTSPTSLYRPFHQDQLASAAAGAQASATDANSDEAPVRKSSSASNLSFLVEAGLLPASIMEEDGGGFFAPGIPAETQKELRAKAPNMSTVFDDDIVDFLASPEYGLPPDQHREKPRTNQAGPYPTIDIPNDFAAFGGVRQDEASAPPAAGQVTYEKPPAATTHPQGEHEETKANTADQRMVPVPDGQKVPFTARSA